MHTLTDDQAWETARVEDLGRALKEVESEIPATELKDYLRQVGGLGVPVRWSSESQEFECR